MKNKDTTIKEIINIKRDIDLKLKCKSYILLDELIIETEPEKIIKTISFLKDNQELMFNQLIDICGVDYLGQRSSDKRFEVVYHLLSMKFNHRIRIKVALAEEQTVPTICEIFKGANWYEREIWDMYGIVFSGHNDLRRILSDYSFDGHALRKDFPLSGYTEIRYDDNEKKIVQEKVNLPQSYREFDFTSPWKDTVAILPGDEKAINNNQNNDDGTKNKESVNSA